MKSNSAALPNANAGTLAPELLWRWTPIGVPPITWQSGNLSLRQPTAAGTAEALACEATCGRTLGTVPGQNFIYVHLNRVIKEYDLNMIYISGPGHGGAALVGNTYLEGTYSEVYPNISEDELA